MKLHLTPTEGNLFTGCGQGWVEVNRARHEGNLLVLPDRIVGGWMPGGYAALTREDFAALAGMQPEIVLLGTGGTIRFPHPRLLADLAAARIGIEVMDVRAVCRTFNVVASEGRRVLAAILHG